MDADRFEALLEQRFRGVDRRAMAGEIRNHDARRDDAFDVGHVRRRIRFHGQIAAPVQTMLRDWVPELLAHAAGQGVRLRDLNHELNIYTPPAYEQARGRPLPPGMRLPATADRFLAQAKVYSVTLVLPRAVRSAEEVLGAIRALLARLLCEIWLRDEVFTLEAYREEAPQPMSLGLPEMLRLLAEEPLSTRRIAQALETHARAIGLNPRRAAKQVRASYFGTLLEAARKNALSADEQALVREAMDTYLAALSAQVPQRVAAMVEAVETLNAQLGFLPPDEAPEYLALREKNPLHYLRSAKLRLEFLLEALGALLEHVDQLGADDLVLSPLLEQRVEGYLAELRAQRLARPYLLEGVRLSDELAQQREAFPLEVHALLQRLPRTEHPERAFKSLSRKIANSIYQRLYGSLVLVQAWIKARDQGTAQTFVASERFTRLKAALANFRFRRPLLEALFLRLGVVLDAAEAQGPTDTGASRKLRLPRDELTRAWSGFLPHVLLVSFFADGTRLPKFDAARYRRRVVASLARQAAAGQGAARLTTLLHHVYAGAEDEGLAPLLEQLRSPTGTWRFVVQQALAPPAGARPIDVPKRGPGEAPAEDEDDGLQRLHALADVLLRARTSSQRNAIVIGKRATTAP
ncbi:MAG: hypothetical protein HY342_02015 [Candidatus Lambdaproteobacteria bacterium]|nr:hypothetical protein [Candidatus Lambdaproteobacteria bacterium]